MQVFSSFSRQFSAVIDAILNFGALKKYGIFSASVFEVSKKSVLSLSAL
jgi:hypothetical protein